MSYQHGQASFNVPLPSQDPPQEQDSDKQRVIEGNFFGGPLPNAVFHEKTIKIPPQQAAAAHNSFHAPKPPSTSPIPVHSWFENTPTSQSEASSAFDSIAMPTSVSSVEVSKPYYSSSAHISHENKHNYEPLNDFGSIPKDKSMNYGSSIDHSTDLTELSYIGDETFERLSTVSLSTSQGHLADNFMASSSASFQCPRCHKANETSSSFCGRCGMQLFSNSSTSQVFPLSTSSQQPLQNSIPPPILPHFPSQAPVPLTAGDSLSVPLSQMRIQSCQGNSITSAQETGHHSVNPIPHSASATSGFTPFVPFSTVASHQQPRTSLFGLRSQSHQSIHAPPSQPKPDEPVAAPIKNSRVHPVFCFGSGGQFIATFPLKQVRFHMEQGLSISNSSHQQYRPGAIYQSPLLAIPRIRDKLVDPFLVHFGTSPISSKSMKLDELTGLLNKWLSENAGNPLRLLAGLFGLLLESKDGFTSIGHDSWIRLLSEGGHMNLSFPEPIQSPTFSPQTTHGVTTEMSKLILNGDRANAVLLAVTNQRWAEALLLSSFVDGETYYSTVSEFTRKTYPLGHPLRLVFLLLAGQSELAGYELHQMGPAIVLSWRAILAMILGNRCQNDYLAITSLGDALLNQKEVVAAHLCHVLSDDASLLGSAADPNSRVTLLGLDHRNINTSTFWRSWVNIRITELFEFCLGAANHADDSFFLPHLLPFKLVYVSYLCDIGFIREASCHLDIIEPQTVMLRSAHLTEKCQDMRLRIGGGAMMDNTSLKQGWLPKVGGLIERVIGVNNEAESASTITSHPSTMPPLTVPMISNPILVNQSSPNSFESDSCEVVDRRWAPSDPHVSGPGSIMMPPNPPHENTVYSPNEPHVHTDRSVPLAKDIRPTEFSNPNLPMPMIPIMHAEAPLMAKSHVPSSEVHHLPQLPSAPLPAQNHYSTESNTYGVGYHTDNRNLGSFHSVPSDQPQAFAAPSQTSPQYSHHLNEVAPHAIYHSNPPAIGIPPLQTGIQPHLSPQIEEEDLGFGNKPRSPQKSTYTSDTSPKVEQNEGDGPAGENQEKKGVLGVITGLFWKKSNTSSEQVGSPKQANLGEPNTFRYDEKLKRWVDSKDPSTSQPIAPPPPPPSSAGPSLTMMPQGPSTPIDPNSFRRGVTRSARSRYVDPLNPNAPNEEVSVSNAPFINPPLHN